MTESKTPPNDALVLVVDDEASIRESLRMILEYEGYEVEDARSGGEALAKVASGAPDAILLDIKMPEMDGLEVLRSLKGQGYEMPILVISGHADLETAVDATRRGAYDFFEKPLQRERILVSLKNAIARYRLEQENRTLERKPDRLVGNSASMRRLRATIEKASPTPATVLITGESGTGKELVARAIHQKSHRKSGPLVMVNCAAIPEELIESELFGHEKGSFTGAVRKQTGKFVTAHGGTIFLDEVGDMSARTQAKVLRVLQDGQVEPVGAEKTIQVDVRVIAATNRDLEDELAAGRFREDLYYRLNVVPVRTPPLREHLEDVPALVEYFVSDFAAAANYPPKTFTADAIETLQGMPWKGNVRELKNLVERLLILGAGDEVDRDDVLSIAGGGQAQLPSALFHLKTLQEFRDESEKLFLLHKLDENEWNVTQTAESVETPRSNLYKKMDKYDIKRDDHV